MRYVLLKSTLCVAAICVAGIWLFALAGTYAQTPAGRPRQAPKVANDPAGQPMLQRGSSRQYNPGSHIIPAEGSTDNPAPSGDLDVIDKEGNVTRWGATRVYTFLLAPGSATPKRISGPHTNSSMDDMASMMGGGMGMPADMSGGYVPPVAEMPGMPSGMPGGGMYSASSNPYGMNPLVPAYQSVVLYAYVRDELHASDDADENKEPPRPDIKVAVPVERKNASMPGSVDAVDMMGMGSSQFVMRLLEDLPEDSSQNANSKQDVLGKLSAEDRKNIAQLIRLDIWIQDARNALKVQSSRAENFEVTEKRLTQLLSEHYDAQLAKLRGDVTRMREKLEQLQSDLERRAQAKERVVDVQVGQLVLEAQGLLNNENQSTQP